MSRMTPKRKQWCLELEEQIMDHLRAHPHAKPDGSFVRQVETGRQDYRDQGGCSEERMTALSLEDLKRLTGEDFSHKQSLTRPKVVYAPRVYRWLAYMPDGSWGGFWEWEDALRWVLGEPERERDADGNRAGGWTA